jgi:hypothetical protein
MALSRKYISTLWYLLASLGCVGMSLALAVSVDDVGTAINPFITLGVYILPIVSFYLLACGLYRGYLAWREMPPRDLGEAVVQRVLRRWRQQEERLRSRGDHRTE